MERPNAELLKSAAVAALGSFLFGFDTAVISGTTDALRLRFGLSEGQLGFTVASALLGTILGSIGSGSPAEKHGRRPVLQVLARALLRVRPGLRLRLGLVVARRVPLRGRPGHRRLLGGGAALHRRDLAPGHRAAGSWP